MNDRRQPPASRDGRRHRRQYLDWMRGLAVLIMIEAHVIDSWTGGVGRASRGFGWSMILGGFGAPLFLFLAGVAVALSAGSKMRRSGHIASAARAVERRGLQIFGLALLFRVQAWILGWAPPVTLLKVDILNIMGPSIVGAAALWGTAATFRGRFVAFTAGTLGVALFTPLVRSLHWLAVLPDPLEAYIRPVQGISSFVLFPWAGFVLAGAVVGLLVDATVEGEREARLNIRLGIVGAAVAAGAYALSFLPSPYAHSDFWTSSPSFFFLRAGLMTTAIGLAYAWGVRPGGQRKWSPLAQLGRTSLFVYWIHVEMVYGLISLPLHKSLTLPQSWAAFALFSMFMLVCSIAKDRVVAWWGLRRQSRGSGAPAEAG